MPPVVRFAPSPTGHLHLGNARTALVNWLFARHHGGSVILRIDDTDRERSTSTFETAIQEDLRWLGLDWDVLERQSERGRVHEAAFARLEASGRVYRAYETAEELEQKRAAQRRAGLPPRYDRAALALSDGERRALEATGRRPHWRFRLSGEVVAWHDLVQGEIAVSSGALSDPVLRRADGGWTYTLASVVDDAALGVSHVIRGDDHRTNTVVQIELLLALGATLPAFAHLPLLTGPGGAPLAKRSGAWSLADYRRKGVEPHAIRLYLAALGTDTAAAAATTLGELVEGFDLARFGRSSAVFDEAQLARLSAAVFQAQPYEAVRARLGQLSPAEWSLLRGNAGELEELAGWRRVIHAPLAPVIEDATLLDQAAALLPERLDDAATAAAWLEAVKQATGQQGRALFHPIRMATTGRGDGPKLADLLPLLGRERVYRRLKGETA